MYNIAMVLRTSHSGQTKSTQKTQRKAVIFMNITDFLIFIFLEFVLERAEPRRGVGAEGTHAAGQGPT